MTNGASSNSELRFDDEAAQVAHRDLKRVIRGEVRFDRGTRGLYATDASNYRHVPIGVIIPRDLDDVVETFKVACAHGLPVLSRGAGTSLAGQCCNVALVLDYSKYVRGVEELDVARKSAIVLPGTNLDVLRRQAEEHGLTFGPDPSTHTHCTLGGMLGNNSCGVHAVLSEFYGPGPRTEDNVEELDVLTYDGFRLTVGPTTDQQLEEIIAQGGRKGTIYARLRNLRNTYAEQIRSRFPAIPRRVSGFNLPALLPENGFNVARALVGTEGTCVAILRARLSLVPHKAHRVLVVLGYSSIFEAGEDIGIIRSFKPVGCEGIDQLLVDYMREKNLHAADLEYLPRGQGWLLVEFGDDTQDAAEGQAARFCESMKHRGTHCSIRVFNDQDEQEHLWDVREAGLGATAYSPGRPDTWPGWEDAAVPCDRIGEYLPRFHKLLEQYGYEASLYGHFAQGCVHCRINFDLGSAQGRAVYESFTRAATELVVELGGSLSGEHGDGQARGDLLPRMYGEDLMEAFREFKAIWDPRGKMNPGKVVDARSRTADLKLAIAEPWLPETHFRFEADDGDFAHATRRCVGVGKCRRESGGTMCPSFMVTREEQHSTRGRAHLLFEMLHGGQADRTWESEPVKESLDLCLACKGCTSECPVSVDIPTYKAEFLAHYYESKPRERQHYAFGLIHRWARIGALAPGLANWASHAPVFKQLARWVANVAPEREIPRLASQTFHRWLRHHVPAHPHGRPVMLWPDTFNNYFCPEVLVAATLLLEQIGFRVTIPDRVLCCGRPLYDYGMLEDAKALWRDILEALEPEIVAGTPLVGLEPSCVAAFRDELQKLIAGNEARTLANQVYTLAEFLEKVESYRPPAFPQRMIWQPHCHQKAVQGVSAEEALYQKLGLTLTQPNDSCCGMAGSFGFEKDKYEISQAIGERRLFPALAQDPHLPVLSDGFSCREQVAQRTGKRPFHTAEVLAAAHGLSVQLGSRPPRIIPLAATVFAVIVALLVFL